MHDDDILLWSDGTWMFAEEWNSYSTKPCADNYQVVPFESAQWFDLVEGDDDSDA